MLSLLVCVLLFLETGFANDNVTVVHLSIEGLSLLEFNFPLGDQRVDRLTCAEYAIANSLKAYQLNNGICLCSLPNNSPKYLRRDENATVLLTFSGLTSTNHCPAGMMYEPWKAMNESVQTDSWAEWSSCPSCGGGLARRRYRSSDDNSVQLREWEERRPCSEEMCNFPSSTCNSGWEPGYINGIKNCVPEQGTDTILIKQVN